MALASVVFVVAALVSLATSWILVTRLERVGERLGLSEALLGILAALAADAPEITSSISALTQHHRTIGAGVVVGSNVFNLAALLGLGAVVSGFVALHRKVVVLGGFVAVWIALCCLATATGLFSTLEGLIPAALVLLAYLVVIGVRRSELQRMPLPDRWLAWLGSAVDDEELELADAVRPTKGRPVDALAAFGALVVVVLSSVVMERRAVELGHHFHVSDAVIGGVVLAAVTSLPNAVAAVHLAAKGRGSAALSTALNSNNLNVVVGLFIPGTLIGLASPSATGDFTAAAFLALTVLVLFLAFWRRGLSRRAGWLIIAGYAAFVAVLLIISSVAPLGPPAGHERGPLLTTRVHSGEVIIFEHLVQISGYAVVRPRSFVGRDFVELVTVAPHERRHGIGSLLLQRAVGSSTTDRIFTSTNHSNVAMIGLLEKESWPYRGQLKGIDEGDPEIVFYKDVE